MKDLIAASNKAKFKTVTDKYNLLQKLNILTVQSRDPHFSIEWHKNIGPK